MYTGVAIWDIGSNRTIVGLKLNSRTRNEDDLFRSNRTIVGLKLRNPNNLSSSLLSSNRTIVGLKRRSKAIFA